MKKLKLFINHEKKLWNCLMIILKLYLKQHKAKYGEGLKAIIPKQMLQRLPIVLAQVKARNTSESLINEIRQIISSFYWPKEIAKKSMH